MYQHPDDDYREDRAAELAEREALEAELLEPLHAGRCEWPGIGPKTRQTVAAARVHGAHEAALAPLFGAARKRRADAIARTMRRKP